MGKALMGIKKRAKAIPRPSIRWAVKADVEAIAEIDYDSFRDSWEPRDLKAAMQDREVRLTIAAVDGETAGYALWYLPTRHDRNEVDLLRIAVAPSRRRHGIGTMLMRERMKHLALGGLRDTAHASVMMDNLPAQLFLRAMGWVASGPFFDEGNEWLTFVFLGGWSLPGEGKNGKGCKEAVL